MLSVLSVVGYRFAVAFVYKSEQAPHISHFIIIFASFVRCFFFLNLRSIDEKVRRTQHKSFNTTSDGMSKKTFFSIEAE